MQRIPLIILLTLVSITTLPAQPSDSLHFSGKRALVFTFSGFNLGVGLGGKYWISNQHFIRVTLTGLFQTDKSDHDLISMTDQNYESQRSEISFSLTLANRFELLDDFLPYVGVDLGVRQYATEYKRIMLNGTTLDTNLEWTLIGGLSLGVEFFASERFSLSGEQKIQLSYAHTRDAKMFRIYSPSSSLLLSVYL